MAFVGQAIAERLLADGHEVIILSRGGQRNVSGTPVAWDGATLGEWAATLEDALAVVNLTGKSVNCRQTQSNRREIVSSRVASVQVIGEALRRCRRPPKVYLQATAVGSYGDAGDKICDESTPPGGGFLGETCWQWEKVWHENPTPGVRRAVLRLGVVLGRRGGAFPPLASLVRFFLGGSVGGGQQYMSWLHVTDAVRIFRDAIDRDDFHGIYVAASPHPATNAQFMRELRARCIGPGVRPFRPLLFARARGLRASMPSWPSAASAAHRGDLWSKVLRTSFRNFGGCFRTWLASLAYD